jgi:hypothetical protein
MSDFGVLDGDHAVRLSVFVSVENVISVQPDVVGVVSECAEHFCDAVLSLFSVDVSDACRVD